MRGFLEKKRVRVLGKDFDFSLSYDQMGRLQRKRYPDGRELFFSYGEGSKLQSISPVLKGLSYNKNGSLEGWVGENGVEVRYQLDVKNEDFERVSGWG